MIADNFDLFSSFVKGVISPFFTNDGVFNCNVTDFVKPSPNAGQADDGSLSAHGTPINGAYPGVGIIKPHSNPS